MRRAFFGAVVAAALAFSIVGTATADRPVSFSFEDTFDDINPCTGLVHTITISGTAFVQEQDGRDLVRAARTITTSPTGFAGHGTGSFVDNGQIVVSRFADIVANDAGERIRAEGVFVRDTSSGIVRVDAFAASCVGV